MQPPADVSLQHFVLWDVSGVFTFGGQRQHCHALTRSLGSAPSRHYGGRATDANQPAAGVGARVHFVTLARAGFRFHGGCFRKHLAWIEPFLNLAPTP